MLTAAFMAYLPISAAHTPAWRIPTWTYISASHSTIGVNQDLLIIFWCGEVPPTAHGIYGDRWTFTVEVTKPDGTKETLGPFTSDPVGGSWALYKPDQVGTYTAVAKFAEHTITGLPMNPTRTISTINGASWVNDTYLASSSDPLQFNVQSDPIEGWPEAPVPTNDCWTRPITSMNRDWYVLAANWLGMDSGAHNVGPTNNFAYGKAPESAHILWAKPIWTGGIMDARFGPTGYQTAHYEGISLNPPIILDGKLYYNVLSNPRNGWYCLDLYTGETLYFHENTGPVMGAGLQYQTNNEGANIAYLESHGAIRGGQLAFGQICDYESMNQHGGFPYLWSTFGPNGEANTWMMFDAYSGDYICSIANVSAAGTPVYGKDGSILRYDIVGSGSDKRLTVWNTSHAIWFDEVFYGHEYALWRPTLNRTFDGRNGFSLNVSIPNVIGTIRAVREDKFVIGGVDGVNNNTVVKQGHLWALSLESGKEGTLLWNISFTPPKTIPETVMAGANPAWRGQARITHVDPEDGVFLFWEPMTRTWYCYSLETGQKIWQSEPEHPLNFYSLNTGGIATCTNIYQGKLFTTGYGGQVLAYDIKTGKVLWTYNATNIGWESPYGNYPLGIGVIADGKLYLGSGEHSPSQPLWRGSAIRCIDANTGEELWKSSHWGIYLHGDHTGSKFAIGDGYLVGLNLYDNQIYCYGKGPSATTVTASPKAISKGSFTVIEGTVTDQSPGAKGSPAIADEDQQAYMEYLYQQQPKPENAKGIQVKLTAIDSDGQVIDIGTVTSDMSGMFKKMWTPPAEGEYTIIATFEGSKSYGSSYAETALGVGPARPSQSIQPSQQSTSDSSMALQTEVLLIGIGIIAVVIVVIAVFVLGKRK